jgi:putative hydrolase of the HAD superfamily
MKSKIKAVVFDLGDVILDWRTPFQAFFNRFRLELNSALDSCKDLIIEAELGKMDTDELCRKMMQRLGHFSQWPNLRKIMPAGFIPREESFSLLKQLKGKYRLAILSNLELGQFEAINKLWRLAQFFETAVISCEIGLRKPDPEIFRYLLNKLGLNSQDCLFIDDLDNNVEAAKKLGFATVRFTDPKASVELIRKRLYGTV